MSNTSKSIHKIANPPQVEGNELQQERIKADMYFSILKILKENSLAAFVRNVRNTNHFKSTISILYDGMIPGDEADKALVLSICEMYIGACEKCGCVPELDIDALKRQYKD